MLIDACVIRYGQFSKITPREIDISEYSDINELDLHFFHSKCSALYLIRYSLKSVYEIKIKPLYLTRMSTFVATIEQFQW